MCTCFTTGRYLLLLYIYTCIQTYKPLFGLHVNHRGVNYYAMPSAIKRITTATNAAYSGRVSANIVCIHGVCNYYSGFNGKITRIDIVRYRQTKRFVRLPTRYGYLVCEWKMKNDQKCECADHIRTVRPIIDERYNRTWVQKEPDGISTVAIK